MIDGFDPDKFRKVNKDAKKAQDNDSGIRIERQFGSASSSDSIPALRRGVGAGTQRRLSNYGSMEMPGVPTYDNSEKQLLASLEQELGVL